MDGTMTLTAVLGQEGVAPGVAGRSGAAVPAGGETGQMAVDPNGQPIGAPQQQAPAGPNPLFFMIIIMGFFVLMIFFSGRQQKKEAKRRAEMLGALRKHDRVVTKGGMIGTIVELRSDEVVLRVDEGTGTRATFSRGAVEGVVKASGTKDEDEDEDVFEEPHADEREAVGAGESR